MDMLTAVMLIRDLDRDVYPGWAFAGFLQSDPPVLAVIYRSSESVYSVRDRMEFATVCAAFDRGKEEAANA